MQAGLMLPGIVRGDSTREGGEAKTEGGNKISLHMWMLLRMLIMTAMTATTAVSSELLSLSNKHKHQP